MSIKQNKNYYRDQRLEKSFGDNHVLNGLMVLHEGENPSY
jgi:hypothetical protein